MRVRRIGALCVTLCLLLAMIPLVSAAGASIVVQAPDKLPDIGESFTVTVSLNGNPGLGAAQVRLNYDDAVLECTEVKNGALVEGMMTVSNPHGTRNGSAALLAAASTTTVTEDGTLAVFTFKVKASGDVKLSITQTTIADGSGTDIPFTYTLPALVTENKTESSAPGSSAPEQKPTEGEPQQTAGTFRDVPSGHWAFAPVERAAKLGLVTGFSDGSFHPDAPVTRAQFVLMLWRMAGKAAAAQKAEFTDTANSGWYQQALDWAVETGCVNGISATQFGPDAPITRQQAMAILFRYSGGQVGAEAMLTGVYAQSFTDSGKIAAWATDAVWWAVYHGLVSGTGNNQIAPEANASRAQIAAILLRYMDQFMTETEAAA